MITRSQKAKFIINQAIEEIEWLSRFLKWSTPQQSSVMANTFRKLMYLEE